MITKKIFLTLILFSTLAAPAFSIDAWIRINNLGYVPDASKKAIFVAERPKKISVFTIHDALTNKQLFKSSNIAHWGAFGNFADTYIFDFSDFKMEGAFYIKANNLYYSPTIYINKNIYLGMADRQLTYFRNNRFTTESANLMYNTQLQPYLETRVEREISVHKEIPNKNPRVRPTILTIDTVVVDTIIVSKNIDGGWLRPIGSAQLGHEIAEIVFQLLFAYKNNSESFADKYNHAGTGHPNGVPDILDEARNGLEWLLKSFPHPDTLMHRIEKSDDDFVGRRIYMLNTCDNSCYDSGIETIQVAAKYASAFALGAISFMQRDAQWARTLEIKALDAYDIAKEKAKAIQPSKTPTISEKAELNWADDLQLAATQLYYLTFDAKYLDDAIFYGRIEPVSPWIFSEVAYAQQWLPLNNYGHMILANTENPTLKNEFSTNLLFNLKRAELRAKTNPFYMGAPMSEHSNAKIVSLVNMCQMYRKSTGDKQFVTLETALVDWLWGLNPWGVSMIQALRNSGQQSAELYSDAWFYNQKIELGTLVSGAVNKQTIDNYDLSDVIIHNSSIFQSDWAIFNADERDFLTNTISNAGISALSLMLSTLQKETSNKTEDKNIYVAGGLVRTDPSLKNISLVFTADKFSDGYKHIRRALKKEKVEASFFFTGNFLRRSSKAKMAKKLVRDGHYVGPHSDTHPLYAAWDDRSKTLLTKAEFLNDIHNNYKALEKIGISKQQAPFFNPPSQNYNDSISAWAADMGIALVNFTPGTRSNADYTTPDMREKYFSSIEIMSQIMKVEREEGLNGHVMLMHFGSDKKRKDKFYKKLRPLIKDLKSKGYRFTNLYESTELYEKPMRKKKK